MIKNVIFDLGGVILDLDFSAALEAFRSIGFQDIDQYLDPYTQKGLFEDVEAGHISATDFHAEVCRHTDHTVSFAATQQAWLAFAKGVDMAKLDYIEQLRHRYRLLLLSNTNPFMMLWADSRQFTKRQKPLSAYFDKMYCSYKIGRMKPHPDIFRYMIEDSGIDPSESLFVDDGTANIATAQQLGFHTYQPQNGENWIPQLDTLLAR